MEINKLNMKNDKAKDKWFEKYLLGNRQVGYMLTLLISKYLILIKVF